MASIRSPACRPGRTASKCRPQAAATSRELTVQVGQTATLNLGVGGVAETATAGEATTLDAVQVVGAAVETRTSEVATYISNKQIEALPQNSRNFLAFADTVPGVQFITDASGNTRLRSGAQSANAVNVFIDGVGQKNYVTTGGVSGQDTSRGNPFPQSAIGEYKVITQNYKAEYDQLSSAAVVAATRSGSNEFQAASSGTTRRPTGVRPPTSSASRARPRPKASRNSTAFPSAGRSCATSRTSSSPTRPRSSAAL